MSWGKRKEQEGNLPQGGWARLDSIQSGKWSAYRPIPVKLPVHGFMEKDINKQSHWFDLEEGTWLQGLVATYKNEHRVYVVTVVPEPEMALIHNRWPRIIARRNFEDSNSL
jgi:putative SOS response-associated peptidase YedK